MVFLIYRVGVELLEILFILALCSYVFLALCCDIINSFFVLIIGFGPIINYGLDLVLHTVDKALGLLAVIFLYQISYFAAFSIEVVLEIFKVFRMLFYILDNCLEIFYEVVDICFVLIERLR